MSTAGTTPVSYNDEFVDPTQAQKYEDSVYAKTSHSSLLWDIEKTQLDELLARYVPAGGRHLDFACGTGRVAGHVVSEDRPVTAVDISSAMVAIGRSVRPGPEYMTGNILDDDFFGELKALGPFDSLSAFRFILNADRSVVQPILGRLAQLLTPHGVAIINNHGDTRSMKAAPHLLGKLTGTKNDETETAVGNYLTPAQALGLFDNAGFEVVDTRGTGVVSGRIMDVIGYDKLRDLEARAASTPLAKFGTNTMYALRPIIGLNQ